jgi:1-aminocyclopropane-1-carboxylate deaminase/D-cysteine desulfhydrase-like pyridoxal-dependent ACC family enzyme
MTGWSRRRFVQSLTLGGAALGATCFSQSRRSLPATGDVPGLPPPFAAPRDQALALAKFFPDLTDPDSTQGPRIVNTLTAIDPSGGRVRQGDAGNAVFCDPGNGRAIIPWTPLFERNQEILRLPRSIKRKVECADLLIWNESSKQQPAYGNKARKYEFLLPNLQWSGVQRTATLGAVSSNHALQFALANRLADLTGNGEPLNSDLDLVLFEVPGTTIAEKRLAILQRLSRRIVLTSNMFGLAGEAAYELANQRLHSHAEAIIPPGGSNELSVLGHVNAIAEFARFLESSQVWDAPPDCIFVAMGSGSTVLGLVLGVHLLGWNTQVVGVADQDKSYLSRFVANQQPSAPFVEGNVIRLAARTLDWLNKINFAGVPPSVDQLLRREAFLPDSNSWAPGYGLIGPADAAWREELASAGIKFDPVFTLKAWRSLVAMARSGSLANKRVLFWNTYNSFDYNALADILSSNERNYRASL